MAKTKIPKGGMIVTQGGKNPVLSVPEAPGQKGMAPTALTPQEHKSMLNKPEIPRGAIPSHRSPVRQAWRNYALIPLLNLFGINLQPDPGWQLDPNANPFEAMENAPENVKKALDDLLDRVATRFEDMTHKLPQNISEEELQQITPIAMPTAEDIQKYTPELQNLDFAPIEEQARRQFSERTIPQLAEQFAGAGGLNSTALKGELGRAGSDLESKLAALKSQYGLEQNQQQLKAHELASKRAGTMGQLGFTTNASNLDRLKTLAGIRGAQNQNTLEERNQLMNLLGLTTSRNTTLEPNPAQQQMKAFSENMIPDINKTIETAGNAAKLYNLIF